MVMAFPASHFFPGDCLREADGPHVCAGPYLAWDTSRLVARCRSRGCVRTQGSRSSSLVLAACPNWLDLSCHAWERQPEPLPCLLSGRVVEIRQHDGWDDRLYVFYAVSSGGSETRSVLFDAGNKVRRGNITFPSYPQPTDESWKQAE